MGKSNYFTLRNGRVLVVLLVMDSGFNWEALLPFLSIFFGIGSILFFGALSVLKNKKKKEELKQIAKANGWEFGLSGKSGQINALGDHPAIAFFEWLLPWILSGNFQGEKFQIYTEIRGSGKNQTTYTVFHMEWKEAFPYRLEITSQGFIKGLLIKVFHLEDILIGDEEFDKRFQIKGEDPGKIKTLLSNPILKKSILKYFGDQDSSEINQFGITTTIRGEIVDREFFLKILGQMQTIVKEVSPYGEF